MGMELEMLYAVDDQLTFSASVGMLDTEITSDTSAEITGGFVVDLQGLELPKAPELTFNLALDYRFDLGGNDAWIRGEFIHRDGQFSDVEALTYLQTDGPSPNSGNARNSVGTYGDFPFRTPDYDVINIRGGVDFGQVSLVLYVQNVADKKYYTGTQENFGISGFRLRPHPRVIGGSLTYSF
jgi:iron complex outermembrane receptor protein